MIKQKYAQLNLEKTYDSNFGSKIMSKISYDRKLVITEFFSKVCPHTNVVTTNFSSGKLLCKKHQRVENSWSGYYLSADVFWLLHRKKSNFCLIFSLNDNFMIWLLFYNQECFITEISQNISFINRLLLFNLQIFSSLDGITSNI